MTTSTATHIIMYVRTLAISLFFSFADANLLSMAVTSRMGRGGGATLPLLSSFRRTVVVEGEVGPRRDHASQQLRNLSRQPVENLATKIVSPDERSLKGNTCQARHPRLVPILHPEGDRGHTGYRGGGDLFVDNELQGLHGSTEGWLALLSLNIPSYY